MTTFLISSSLFSVFSLIDIFLVFYRITLVKENYRKISLIEGCCVTGVPYVRQSVMSGKREGAHITKTAVAREVMLPFFSQHRYLCFMYNVHIFIPCQCVFFNRMFRERNPKVIGKRRVSSALEISKGAFCDKMVPTLRWGINFCKLECYLMWYLVE